jgi:hypothetical protein
VVFWFRDERRPCRPDAVVKSDGFRIFRLLVDLPLEAIATQWLNFIASFPRSSRRQEKGAAKSSSTLPTNLIGLFQLFAKTPSVRWQALAPVLLQDHNNGAS